jgi:hypothetical protein
MPEMACPRKRRKVNIELDLSEIGNGWLLRTNVSEDGDGIYAVKKFAYAYPRNYVWYELRHPKTKRTYRLILQEQP